ncbi:pyridoxal-phosphate dependent enzyme [Patescibacteria group bacterium]|nr:pyridoxal-phosphate dependent enzyme [Patescibacteria group bacterium]MDE1946784.1 PLP-dependent lyase/thiolase [Patescibacteria group bacterium]MDE2011084.1 PLP-dependent lyase/thiolase [Patescibacteria group bacterium]MDE2233141.1 PLP-dependent lyase/thiolase [Patescibacteria group bacterium]
MNTITPTGHYPELAKAINASDLYFKREDLHPYGSHKGRSIPVMISYYLERGDRKFAISSSGNAALAAAMHIKRLNADVGHVSQVGPVHLAVFVGSNISPAKLDKLKALVDDNIQVKKKDRPLQALAQATGDGSRSLRQSTDDTALIGYKTLAEELAGIENVGAVFIGTSSGTTAQALAQSFLENKQPTQVHIVQTSSCHPIADAFGPFDIPEEKSDADAVVDHIAYRKNTLVPLIEKTGGHGWIASNEEIRSVRELVEKHAGLKISSNGALSVVGVMQAARMNFKVNGSAVCLICGD